ncbi:FUSC family protein [Chitinophagaceae bacterium MMS25-I14]
MSYLQSYKRLNQFIQNETFEPTLNWGLRMAIASVVPVLWGVYTGHMDIAEWITLTAEGICWVELRGGAGLRFRTLVAGTCLALFFAILGAVTGVNIWLSLVGMLFVGFVASLFKNLGDRGSGLSTGAFVMFIICNAYPPKTVHALELRSLYIFIGGLWSIVVGMAASAFVPEQEPYRRSIALIWKSISSLIDVVAKGWDGKGVRSNLRDVYLKEKDVRAAIDSSLHFHESMAHQVSTKKTKEYRLAQARKATSLVAAQIIAISEEMEGINFQSIDNAVKLKVYALNKALQQTVDRMAVYVLTLKSEEEILLTTRMRRLEKLISFLRQYPLAEGSTEKAQIARILHLTERTIKMVETTINHLKELGEEQPIYKSYSLIKTIYVLHPKYLLRNIRLLFNMNTFTAKYALRTGLAATLALFISKWFHINHGYWLPFTVIIVIQPYFGATIKKAVDRTIGTVLGGIVGGLLIRLPTATQLKAFFMFVCGVFMVYYLRKKYSVAAFFITVSLVLLFAVEEELNIQLLLSRLLCTVAGAALGIIAGFALLPTWDKKYLPRYLAESIAANCEYFRATFFPATEDAGWTKYKRVAETKNSNSFDSFNRYMQEPTGGKKSFTIFYQLITYNVRVTRELNNIHLERESNTSETSDDLKNIQMQKEQVIECLQWFNKSMSLLRKIDPAHTYEALPEAAVDDYSLPFPLTLPQVNYLDKLIVDLKSMYQDLEELSGVLEKLMS